MKFGNLQFVVIALSLVSIVASVPIFTGKADDDFGALTGRDLGAYHRFHDPAAVASVSPYMAGLDRGSGLDIFAVHVFYDEITDTLYTGVECDGICGDADGDGNPSGVDTNNPDPGSDPADMCDYEGMAILMWNGVPDTFTPNPTDPFFYYPNTVVGKPFGGCINAWGAFEFPGWQTCYPAVEADPNSSAALSCTSSTKTINQNACNAGSGGAFSLQRKLTNTASASIGTKYTSKGVVDPIMHTLNIDISKPDIEYTLINYSKYPGFPADFVPGTDTFNLLLATYSGSLADKAGEDKTPPTKMKITYDCFHTPNGNAVYDQCGVCGGDDQSCIDCAGTPNGVADYDACGVCGGDNNTCVDCFHVPNGNAEYDECGVCGGDDTTCQDCAHTPNGDLIYDACGLCGGDNTTCQDCAHVPNGISEYDECGVCAGDNTTCMDCFHVPNGGAEYDRFGICGGSGIGDCFDDPYGNAVYDACGVCGGANETCTCYGYLGYKAPYLCYALVRWSVAAAKVKIDDTLDVLYAIKQEIPFYEYESDKLQLDDYIDSIHHFCDGCLDQFDYAQVWFADRLAGNCVGANCDTIVKEDFTWSL